MKHAEFSTRVSKLALYDALLLEGLLQWVAVRIFHSQSPFIRV